MASAASDTGLTRQDTLDVQVSDDFTMGDLIVTDIQHFVPGSPVFTTFEQGQRIGTRPPSR